MPVESPLRANLCTADYIKAENIAELTCCPGLQKADLLKGKNRVNVFYRYKDYNWKAEGFDDKVREQHFLKYIQ